ncbi:lipoyl(octanoyl) transferase LipB [Candidatus Erwinia haradaeae]|uniref:Octanoyltransferase n=1 Tax=Candidatus Erwinia haradaeae TaxID=1922217 RepID=A0A451D2E0_9GAMM|nr:lipoyl(octanoyl) transferase LipB [Candidatus Erwinia haradaeae]VFP79806.1 Octanoyltransferase [Candidatus Erwinia haradaeae]
MNINILYNKECLLSPDTLVIRQLGLCSWVSAVFAMKHFTNERNQKTPDEIWLVEHPSIFTKGQTSEKNSLFMIYGIPIMQSDRGGKITYHGPGQQILYIMLNLKRRKLNIHQLVTAMEQTVLSTLSEFSINAHLRPGSHGVYVEGKKICSLGLRIHNGCSYHGLALNINMNLTPFLYINPCGDSQIKMTQLIEHIDNVTLSAVQPILIRNFLRYLNIKNIHWSNNI